MAVANLLMLIGFPYTNRYWVTAEEFVQENTEMKLIIGSNYTKILDFVVTELQTKTSSVFVFANSCRLTHNLVKGLESKCD